MQAWKYLPVALLLITTVIAGAQAVARRRRHREWDHALSAFAGRLHDGGVTLEARCAGREPSAPAWFLSGVASLRADAFREAARAFGMAHHADHRLISAALLTFATLKARESNEAQLLDLIVQTWVEMGRPDVLFNGTERFLIRAIALPIPEKLPLTRLGRLVWCVVSADQRARLIDPGAESRWPELIGPRDSCVA